MFCFGGLISGRLLPWAGFERGTYLGGPAVTILIAELTNNSDRRSGRLADVCVGA